MERENLESTRRNAAERLEAPMKIRVDEKTAKEIGLTILLEQVDASGLKLSENEKN